MAYFTSQAGVNEFLAGAQLQYDLTGDGEKQLLLGVYNRLGESLIPQIGFELNSIRFSFTYDAGVDADFFFACCMMTGSPLLPGCSCLAVATLFYKFSETARSLACPTHRCKRI